MGAKSSTEQKQTTHCSINDLADKDLANVFKYLPPQERLPVSEVSKRWCGISRIPWRDVGYLDLTPIPGENIGPIVQLCPNLRTVFAKDKNFKLGQLDMLSRVNLSSLKLYQCSSAIREPRAESVPLFSVFSDNLPNASWKELVLCCADFVVDRGTENNSCVLGALPASLERLQLNALNAISPPVDSVVYRHDADIFTNCLMPLRQLTCLILCVSSDRAGFMSDWELPLSELRMENLRELCIDFGDQDFGHTSYCSFDTLAVDLPRLEILFLNNVVYVTEDKAEQLATKHPALRILCITGSLNDERTIPVRRRFPNGFGADPVPKLHVFVGKQASENIVFTKSPTDALEIHSITDPLPEFLEKGEIAPLFEGVWIAAQIKESAKHGSNWWKYEGDTATSFHTADDV